MLYSHENIALEPNYTSLQYTNAVSIAGFSIDTAAVFCKVAVEISLVLAVARPHERG